jgi:hypothetical protein
MKKTQLVVTAVVNENDIFGRAGFPVTKNLITIKGVSILGHVMREYLDKKLAISVVLLKKEIENFQTDLVLKELDPNIRVVTVNDMPAGALCSALLGVDYGNLDSPLVVAPGDSITKSDTKLAIDYFLKSNVDAGTIVFESQNPEYSYVRVSGEGRITEIAEKRIISNFATTGLFYFRDVHTFLEGANWALVNATNYNGQYFMSHSFHRILSLGKSTAVFRVSKTDNYESYRNPGDIMKRLENH